MVAPVARRHSGRMELTLLDGYARCALEGPRSTAEASRQIVAAVASARKQAARRLLVDLRAMAITREPSIAERYELGSEVLRVGAGMRRIAFLLHPERLTLYEFTFLVASSRGLPTEAFATEQQALAWLFSPPGRWGGLPKSLFL